MAANGETQVASADGWPTWLGKTGINAGIIMAVLYWVGTYMVIPLRDGQDSFVKSVVESNNEQVKIAAKNAENVASLASSQKDIVVTQQAQTEAIREIANAKQKMLDVLEQIRDQSRVRKQQPNGAEGE